MFKIRFSKQAKETKVRMPKGIAEGIDAELESIAARSVDLLLRFSKALCCDMEDLIRANQPLKP